LRAVAGQAKRPDLGEFLQLIVLNAFGHERWALARAHTGIQSGSMECTGCLRRFHISGLS